MKGQEGGSTRCPLLNTGDLHYHLMPVAMVCPTEDNGMAVMETQDWQNNPYIIIMSEILTLKLRW